MFGALNRFISRLDSDAPSPSHSHPSHNNPYGASGFQVLRNKNTDIPIDPWYDFIIGINNRPLTSPAPHPFALEIRNCAGATVTLTIWSAKGQRIRTLRLPVPTPSPTLGLTLQWTPLASTEDVWHILDVIPGSPADVAGLLPYGDFIVGTPEGSVRGEAGLGELVEDFLSRRLRLWVYNHEYGVTRVVSITPERGWGGEGALGCVLGFGALHRVPAPLNEPPDAPGETVFDEMGGFGNEGGDERSASATTTTITTTATTANHPNPYPNSALYPNTPTPNSNSTPSNQQQSGSADILIPATLPFSSRPPPPPPPLPGASFPPGTGAPTRAAAAAAARKAARKVISPHAAFDEYFKEGEQKSKEEDFAPGAVTKSALPPPPKKMTVGAGSGAPPPSSVVESTEGMGARGEGPEPQVEGQGEERGGEMVEEREG